MRGRRRLAILAVLGIGLPLLAITAACSALYAQFLAPPPTATDLAPYAISPPGKRVVRFEFAADRRTVLYLAAVEPDSRATDIHRWDVATRRDTFLGRVNLPDNVFPHTNQDLVAATDGGFYILLAGAVARITPDGQIETYRIPGEKLPAAELRAIAAAYSADPGRPIPRVDLQRRDQARPVRYHFLRSEGLALAFCCLPEGPLYIINWEYPAEPAVLANPIVDVAVPANPDHHFRDLADPATSPLTSRAEGLRIEWRRYGCIPVPMARCPTLAYLVTVQGRQYALDGTPPRVWTTPYVPWSGFLTARDGTLLWTQNGTLHALR